MTEMGLVGAYFNEFSFVLGSKTMKWFSPFFKNTLYCLLALLTLSLGEKDQMASGHKHSVELFVIKQRFDGNAMSLFISGPQTRVQHLCLFFYSLKIWEIFAENLTVEKGITF